MRYLPVVLQLQCNVLLDSISYGIQLRLPGGS